MPSEDTAEATCFRSKTGKVVTKKKIKITLDHRVIYKSLQFPAGTSHIALMCGLSSVCNGVNTTQVVKIMIGQGKRI